MGRLTVANNLKFFSVHSGLALAILLFVIAPDVTSSQEEQIQKTEVTTGAVQRGIRIGMSSTEVVEVLGSPNLVTTDKDRTETWVYDKMSTSTVRKTKSGGVRLLIIGGSAGQSTEVRESKNLTVIIKFDENGLVKDFSYRSSKF
jgi:outer membrane protein assembly factor BamE (lipoprotein component of BamABCDE complex)